MFGFLSRLFGSKKQENPEVVEEAAHLDIYPNNKLVRFQQNDSSWPDKLAIILSREEKTEIQLKEIYKKQVPFFYKVAVQNEEGKFMRLKIPVSHLRINVVTQEELESFKKINTSIKLVDPPASMIADSKELITQDEVNRWNELIDRSKPEEHE